MYTPPMLDDRRLDSKLSDLTKELRARPLVAGFPIADAFTVKGVDEAGRPGLFAAVLLAPNTEPELDTLTEFREVLTKKLKQLDTSMPAWPIVVQGAPEIIDGVATVPGGNDYFQQLKGELLSRAERLKQAQARKASLEMPAVNDPNDRPKVGAKPASTPKTQGRKSVKDTSPRIARLRR